MLELVGRGISLGFFAGAVPGPLHTLLVNETLLGGWRRSFVIAFSPLLTDIPIIVVVVFLLDQLPDKFLRAIQLVGGFFVLYLAYRVYALLTNNAASLAETSAVTRKQTLGRAMIVNWLNPAPYLFWATVNGPLLLQGLDKSPLTGLMYLASFYGTFSGLMLVIAFVFDRLRGFSERLNRGMLWVSVGLLIFFGVTLIGQVVL